MPTRLICPTCGRALTVSDNAPARLTCPNCIAALINPMAGQVKPLPVIPVDREAGGDASATQWILIGLIALMAIGVAITLVSGGHNGAFEILIAGALLALIILASALKSRRDKQPATPPTEFDTSPPQPLAPGQPPLLPYSRYRPGLPPEPTNPWAAAGGFFAALAVCAAGFFTLGFTLDGYQGKHGLILLGVVTFVLVFIFSTPGLASRPSWRGYGRGVTIGMCLGLLALAPCAFCYTFTLP